MTSSGVSFVIPVVPEPVDTDADSYFWSTAVKDGVNQLSTAVGDHDDRLDTIELETTPAYGMLYIDDNSVALTGLDTTPVQFSNASSIIGPSYRMTSNRTATTLDIEANGVYDVGLNIAFSGSPNIEFGMYLYKNGVSTDIGLHRLLGATGDVGSASCRGLIDCESGNTLSVYVFADTSGKEITAVDAQFCATLIHGKE